MLINSLEQAEKVLQRYVPNVSKLTGDSLSPERMFILLDLLGNPEDKLKVIHIAGTSGKTSTAYFISSILTESGQKVGLTVSPHVDSVTERIQINSCPISDKEFCAYLSRFLEIISPAGNHFSYFEIIIAFAFWVFAEEKVDYAVVETGLGGLLDSTNVTKKPDKICVITDIGYDHMQILGNTISEIAEQKAGIIQEHNEVFTYEHSNEVMEQIKNRVSQTDAKLNIVSDINLQDVDNLPAFQKRNFGIARQVCEFVTSRDNIELNNSLNTINLVVPGRMDTNTLPNGSLLIMDGAHNGQKVGAFSSSFRLKYRNKKAIVMLALKTGKEYKEVIDELKDITESFILTTFNTSQDLPAVSQDPKTLKVYCDQIGIKAEVINDQKQAYDRLIESDRGIKLVIGSFYLLGQIRKL